MLNLTDNLLTLSNNMILCFSSDIWTFSLQEKKNGYIKSNFFPTHSKVLSPPSHSCTDERHHSASIRSLLQSLQNTLVLAFLLRRQGIYLGKKESGKQRIRKVAGKLREKKQNYRTERQFKNQH